MKKVEDRYIYNKQNNSKMTTTIIIPRIVENGSLCAERAPSLVFFLFSFLVTAAGIVRVVEVKFARAQGIHDDVEDTKLTGG
jgi:hypothetical protein